MEILLSDGISLYFTIYIYMYFVYLAETTGLQNNACNNGHLYLNQTEGYIQSPNYPNNYPSSQYCVWKIKAKSSQLIKISMLDFDLDPSTFELSSQAGKLITCQDHVAVMPSKVFNGDGQCGQLDPFNETINSSEIWIVFQSHWKSKSGRGFKLKYLVIGCKAFQKPPWAQKITFGAANEEAFIECYSGHTYSVRCEGLRWESAGSSMTCYWLIILPVCGGIGFILLTVILIVLCLVCRRRQRKRNTDHREPIHKNMDKSSSSAGNRDLLNKRYGKVDSPTKSDADVVYSEIGPPRRSFLHGQTHDCPLEERIYENAAAPGNCRQNKKERLGSTDSDKYMTMKLKDDKTKSNEKIDNVGLYIEMSSDKKNRHTKKSKFRKAGSALDGNHYMNMSYGRGQHGQKTTASKSFFRKKNQEKSKEYVNESPSKSVNRSTKETEKTVRPRDTSTYICMGSVNKIDKLQLKDCNKYYGGQVEKLYQNT